MRIMGMSKRTQRNVVVVVSFRRSTEVEEGHTWSPGEKPSYFHTAVSGYELCLCLNSPSGVIGWQICRGKLDDSLPLHLCLSCTNFLN